MNVPFENKIQARIEYARIFVASSNFKFKSRNMYKPQSLYLNRLESERLKKNLFRINI